MAVGLQTSLKQFVEREETSVEAVMLVGGQGTRLRPLTENTPKPMLPVANFPCTAHQIVRARDAGVSRIILSTSYKAEVFESYFGSGKDFGIEIVYVTEESPLGTGGAIRNVASALKSAANEPVVILNGDILSGHSIEEQVHQHQQRNADVSLHLIDVEDPRAFGLVPTDESGRVLQFLEKPQTPEEIVTHQINAGCYVFTRSVIDEIPAGRVVSVERETFPGLLANNARVFGYVENAYWLDLGTPLAYVQGSRDLVSGICPSSLVANPGAAVIDASARVAEDACVVEGSAVGSDVTVDSGAIIEASVLLPGAHISAGARIRNSIVGAGARIGERVELDFTVVGDSAIVGSDNQFPAGSRVWTQATINSYSVRT